MTDDEYVRTVKIDSITLSDYEKRESARFAKNFAQHTIVKRDERSWMCRGPKGSEFWFEAIVSGPILTVVGDFDPTSFAYGSGTPRNLVSWIGGCEHCDGYVLQKATIGTGYKADVRTFNTGVWFDRALGFAEEFYNEVIDTSKPVDLEKLFARGVPDWLIDMIDDVACDGEDALSLRDLPEAASDVEAYGWGEVPSSRVVLAHAALHRLNTLLVAEETKEQT